MTSDHAVVLQHLETNQVTGRTMFELPESVSRPIVAQLACKPALRYLAVASRGGQKRMSNTGQALYRRARKVMPGGTQLLSKRPEMFLPEQWPTYFKSAKGAEPGPVGACAALARRRRRAS